MALMSHDTEIWYRRLGHLNFQYLKILRNKSIGVNFMDQQFQPCETCTYGKQTEQPYGRSNSSVGEKGELIHTDLCEVNEKSLKNSRYFLTFMDD